MSTDALRLTLDNGGRPVVLIEGAAGALEYRVVSVERWDDRGGGRRVRLERDGDEEGELVAYSCGVWPDERRWECSCNDALYRRAARPAGCKHVRAVRHYLALLDAMTGR